MFCDGQGARTVSSSRATLARPSASLTGCTGGTALAQEVALETLRELASHLHNALKFLRQLFVPLKRACETGKISCHSLAYTALLVRTPGKLSPRTRAVPSAPPSVLSLVALAARISICAYGADLHSIMKGQLEIDQSLPTVYR